MHVLQIVQVQVITTGIFDNFPNIKQTGKTITRLLVCVLGFILGLMCVSQVTLCNVLYLLLFCIPVLTMHKLQTLL